MKYIEMIKRKNIQFILLGLAFTMIVLSCNKLIFRDVECREPNHTSHLNWFAGGLNDTITFLKPDSSLIKFVIDDKFIFHRTQYTSDTGCGCHDLWGIRMVSGSDTISMYNQEKYVEDNESSVTNEFYVTIDGVTSIFITEDKSSLSSLSIKNTSIMNVIKYKFENDEEGQFKEIYIAENIGIIQMVDATGGNWINENLTTFLDVNLSSFMFEENTCN